MPREEKGSPMGINNAPNTGSGADGGSSLAARRARLRGSLARASFPQDDTDKDSLAVSQSPLTEEPSGSASASSVSTPTATMAEPEPQAPAEPLLQETPIPASDPTASSDPLLQPYSQLQPEQQQQQEMPSAAPTVALSELDSYLENITKTKGKGTTAQFEPAPAPTAPPTPTKKAAKIAAPEPQVAMPVSAPLEPLPPVPENSIEILTNIDTALNACATNLAALQRLAGEQTDVLKGLTDTLQNQTLFEIGLNLNSLTESLSAALEPMKAIGELVPAMDQLVSALEGREVDNTLEKLSPDQLVTSLADQLSAGVIDPWTFKCAYMAIYPSEHPADLLHRLVELLGTQRLSGDLFRAAYEAVQGAEPPSRGFSARTAATTSSGDLSSIDSEEIRAQIEELQRANEETARRQEVREVELQNLLKAKDEELQEAQELLNSRYDEFNARYEEVADALNKREDEYRALLESKDMELVEKESELNLLRAQMEELRNQTEDMVKDMQQQLQDIKLTREEAPPQTAASLNQGAAGGFFEASPQQPRGQFEAPPGKQPFEPQQMQQATSSGQVPVMQAPQPVQSQQQQSISQQMPVQQMPPQQQPQPAGQTLTQPMPVYQAQVQSNGAMQPPNAGPQQQQPTQQMARPAQAQTTPFTPGPGSYGSGVRAQVFEVIVRQALAGAPWREICAGPMQVNNISPEEVETEVKRRQAMLK